MVDRKFADLQLAALYDAFCMGRPDFAFYLPLVLAAEAVLDVGCGTGELLRLAREAGHTVWLCGLDPAEAMLAQARQRRDIEWELGDLTTVTWEDEFDLAVMTGHAFQVLLEDDEIHAALAAVRQALAPGGVFAFETRNPAARGWEAWTPDNAVEIVDEVGARVRMVHQVETPITGELVSFNVTYTSPDWDQPRASRSTLRFLGAHTLGDFLAEAGFTIAEQYGDWDRSPLTAASPEIITIARVPQP